MKFIGELCVIYILSGQPHAFLHITLISVFGVHGEEDGGIGWQVHCSDETDKGVVLPDSPEDAFVL